MFHKLKAMASDLCHAVTCIRIMAIIPIPLKISIWSLRFFIPNVSIDYMSAKDITQATFKQEVLDQKGFVFVDFHAEWCGPCKMTEPIIEQLSGEIKDVVFVKVDVDQNAEIASQFSVFSIHTFIFFKDGKVVNQFVGAMGKEGFLKEIEKVKSS